MNWTRRHFFQRSSPATVHFTADKLFGAIKFFERFSCIIFYALIDELITIGVDKLQSSLIFH